VTGLGEQLRGGPGKGELGSKLRRASGKTRRHPAPSLHAEELQERREPAATPTSHLGKAELHPSQPGKQHAAPGTATPPPEPPVAVARWTPKGRSPAAGQGRSPGSTHRIEHDVLVGLQQPGPDLGSQLPLGVDGGSFEPDEVLGF
jgi:hypothetical protein